MRKTGPSSDATSPLQKGGMFSSLRSKIRPVNRASLSDEIIEQIMSLIASGDLRPGQRLPPERELCKTFQTGRPALREAIRALCIVGILNARVGDGTCVATDGKKFMGKIVEWRLITEKHDLENLMEVRISLEGLAVANAARYADDVLVASLEKQLIRMKSAVDRMDRDRFVELDLEFHVTLAQAAKNHLLIDLVSMIRGQLALGLAKVAAHPRALPLSYKEHREIVEAVKRRNPKVAAQLMQQHLERSRRRYRADLRSLVAAVPTKPSTVRKLREKK
jgi:GntR family transcriptional repressor for pyruvate dehydrogenase complex